MNCALEFDNLRFFGHRKHPQETPNSAREGKALIPT